MIDIKLTVLQAHLIRVEAEGALEGWEGSEQQPAHSFMIAQWEEILKKLAEKGIAEEEQ